MSAADDASMVLSCATDIGLALQQHREKKHISLEDAARELRLSVRQVAALESGQFAGFRSAVFVKGYFRTCAKLYGMDGDALIRAYERVEPQVETVLRLPMATASREVISAPNRSKKYLAAVLVSLVLVAVVSYWQWTLRAVEQPTASTLDMPADQSVASDGVMDAVLDNAAAQSSPSGDNALPELVASVVLNNSAASDTAITDSTTGAKIESPDSVLHMEFSDDCWVQIKSEEGKILHEKNYGKGEVLDMTASPPLHVWLGRAAATNISYNGVLVSVPIKPGYQTAQFVLGDDTQSSRVE